MRAFFLLLAVLVAPPAVAIEQLTLVVAGDLDGALAPASCAPGEPSGRTLGHLAASIAEARAAAESDGRRVVAVVHLGDVTGPAAVGRFLTEEPDGARTLAGLVARAGVTHLLPGNNWFDRKATLLAELAPALQESGITLLSTNVRCEDREDCAAMQSLPAWTEVRLDDWRLAFAGALDPGVLASIDPGSREGLSATPLGSALSDRALAARTAGARVVVGFTHLVGGEPLDAIARIGEESRGIDLLVANRVAEAPDATAVFEFSTGGALVIAGRSPTHAVRIDLDVEREDGTTRVLSTRAVAVREMTPEPTLHADALAIRDAYCARLAKPLAAHTPRPLSPREFLSFVLDEIRLAARTELAAANAEVVDARIFPLDGAVTAADVFAALPYESELVRVEVPGAKLRTLFRNGAAHNVAWAGISERDGKIFVNDRPLEDPMPYAIALPGYIARRSATYLGEALVFEPVSGSKGESLEVRALTLAALSNPARVAKLGEGDGLDLANRPRWSWSSALTLGANDTRLANDATYDDVRLTRAIASTLRGEGTGRIDAHTSDHAVRLSGRARYGRTTVRTEDGSTSSEAEDQIFGEALYRLSSLRTALGEAWYAPSPYASGALDTEFTRNDGAPWRRMEAAANLGVRLSPVRPIELKVGAGARRQLLDPDGRTRLGIELGYELPRFSPIRLRGLPVDVESGLDYFVADLAGETQQEGRLRARLLLPLGGPLSIAAGIDVLTLKRGDKPFAIVSDTTLGITARLDGARQQF